MGENELPLYEDINLKKKNNNNKLPFKLDRHQCRQKQQQHCQDHQCPHSREKGKGKGRCVCLCDYLA